MADQTAVEHITAFLELMEEYDDHVFTPDEYLILKDWAIEADALRESMTEEEGLALDGMMLACGLMKPEHYHGPEGPVDKASDRECRADLETGELTFHKCNTEDLE